MCSSKEQSTQHPDTEMDKKTATNLFDKLTRTTFALHNTNLKHKNIHWTKELFIQAKTVVVY